MYAVGLHSVLIVHVNFETAQDMTVTTRSFAIAKTTARRSCIVHLFSVSTVFCDIWVRYKKLRYTTQLTAVRGWFTGEKCEKSTMSILWNIHAG